jgi:hypothetical protein
LPDKILLSCTSEIYEDPQIIILKHIAKQPLCTEKALNGKKMRNPLSASSIHAVNHDAFSYSMHCKTVAAMETSFFLLLHLQNTQHFKMKLKNVLLSNK